MVFLRLELLSITGNIMTQNSQSFICILTVLFQNNAQAGIYELLKPFFSVVFM